MHRSSGKYVNALDMRKSPHTVRITAEFVKHMGEEIMKMLEAMPALLLLSAFPVRGRHSGFSISSCS